VTRQVDTAGFGILDFAIDRTAEVPIGVQLAWALRVRIRDGRLEPGQRLPGLRELAEALEVNANTVRAVYQRLEHEGMIESQRGSGTFVSAEPHQQSAAGEIAANAAREAHQTGVDPREVAAALYVDVEPARADRPRSDEQSERRRRLRTQIAALEQALGEIEIAHPGLLPSTRKSRPGRGPRLLSVEELEQVQTHLVRRLAAIQIAIDESEQEPAPVERARTPKPAPKRVASARAKARPAPAGAKARPAPAGA
jgi:DNA-binding transcriptional regulator YhcF (GntR family)